MGELVIGGCLGFKSALSLSMVKFLVASTEYPLTEYMVKQLSFEYNQDVFCMLLTRQEI